MGADLINRVIASVGERFGQAVDALVPLGTAVTGSFIILSLVFLGLSVMFGLGGLVPAIMRVTGAATLTLWAIRSWGDIVRGTLQATRQILALVIPNYDGPTALFTMAIDLFGRIELEHVAWTWSVQGVATVAAAAVAPILVLVGLSFTGVLAAIAELQLLIGATAAPLVLPALAFSVTVPLGWGPIYFVTKAGVRVVVMGLAAWVMASAVSSALSVPGSTDSLTSEAVATLSLLSVFCLMVGLYCNGLANDLVGGGAGSLGLGAVGATAEAVGGMASGGLAAASGVGVPAVKAGAAVGTAGVKAVTRSSGRGSAFN